MTTSSRSRSAPTQTKRAGGERSHSSPPHTLREYAVLADGNRGILVGPRGDFAWMCFPSWDSDAIFSALAGGVGHYSITPRARFVWGGYYEEGSLIWRSRWVTVDNAIIECREALTMPSRPDRAVILRRLIAVDGDARVGVLLHPRGSYGDAPFHQIKQTESGHWVGRVGGIHLCWAGGQGAIPENDGRRGKLLTLELDLVQGQQHDFILTMALESDQCEPPVPEAAWSATEAAWAAHVPAFEQTVAPRDARHAYAVLAGMTSPGGGMVAAATMSLPERARQGRNYDYRYVWIRDQCYAGCAVAKAGTYPLLDEAVRFVREKLLEHGPDLKPAYTPAGGPVPDQRHLELSGYPGASVVLGNWVNDQFQLDIFGEALQLFAAAAASDRLDSEGWRAAEMAADVIRKRWKEKDAGIWELEPDRWTHSRLICAAGLRAISASRAPAKRAAAWLVLADAITADTSARALHPSGRWQRSPTDRRVDAALLLAGIRGAIPADDPRTRATLRAVEDELAQDGYVYRYRPDQRPLGEAEGAFLVCGFCMALAYAQQDDPVAAARWFERNRAACGPPGLLSEEFDVTQRQLRGNLPQAFVHALLLECAVDQHLRASKRLGLMH